MKTRGNTGSLFSVIAIITALLLSAVSANANTPSTSVEFNKALQDAQRVAKMNPNWDIMMGTGDSMDPYYGDNSLLIVDKVDFSKLRAGMIVVYRSSENKLIAHRLVSIEGDNGTLRGHRNSINDPENVNSKNLVGVVFGIIHANAPEKSINELYAAANNNTLPLVHGQRF